MRGYPGRHEAQEIRSAFRKTYSCARPKIASSAHSKLNTTPSSGRGGWRIQSDPGFRFEGYHMLLKGLLRVQAKTLVLVLVLLLLCLLLLVLLPQHLSAHARRVCLCVSVLWHCHLRSTCATGDPAKIPSTNKWIKVEWLITSHLVQKLDDDARSSIAAMSQQSGQEENTSYHQHIISPKPGILSDTGSIHLNWLFDFGFIPTSQFSTFMELGLTSWTGECGPSLAGRHMGGCRK